MRQTPMLGWFSIALAGAIGCAGGSESDPDGDPDEGFTAPTTPAQVGEIYSRLGTCNDSFIVRGFAPRIELGTSSLWTTPASSPAGFVRLRAVDGGWPAVLAVSELSGSGVGGSVTATSPDAPCIAVNRLFSPHKPEGSERSEYLHALFYVGDSQHPYTSYPVGGPSGRRGEAQLMLKSYLNPVSAVRDTTNGSVFKDTIEQHLPMYVSCSAPLQIETTLVNIEQRAIASVDRAMCAAGRDDDGDGMLSYRCIAERVVSLEANTCTFVVDGSTLENAGQAAPVIFGGTLTTRGSGIQLSYDIRIDRFSTAR